MLEIYKGDNIDILKNLNQKFELIYTDPPFNTGKTQKRDNLSYDDSYLDYINFLKPRLELAHDLLTEDGSLFVHLDYREVHYIKVELDKIFGRRSFINEIIWAYDYGARSKKRWSAKHDNILWYAKNPSNYIFNFCQMDRIPYMAPALVGPEKAAIGKTPTDVWFKTIVPTNSKEKTGYPTQKPLSILNRIVTIHSNVGSNCLDFFAGSGSFGDACYKNSRNCVLIDQNEQAIDIMKKRFSTYENISFH